MQKQFDLVKIRVIGRAIGRVIGEANEVYQRDLIKQNQSYKEINWQLCIVGSFSCSIKYHEIKYYSY